ncbi:MAG: hypothetical protein ABI551_20310, partial [Polyangiaceae bacterium]
QPCKHRDSEIEKWASKFSPFAPSKGEISDAHSNQLEITNPSRSLQAQVTAKGWHAIASLGMVDGRMVERSMGRMVDGSMGRMVEWSTGRRSVFELEPTPEPALELDRA